jgi:hypothetical protein
MVAIYQLRDDAEAIACMQRGSLDTSPIGLRITHGLIGSVEWWHAIDVGALPAQTIVGTVSGFWPGQYRTGPAEFEITEPSGRKSHWMCELEPIPAEQAYRIGRPVRVQYVHQRLKTLLEGNDETKVVVSIAVE